jgi:hypothetical protein
MRPESLHVPSGASPARRQALASRPGRQGLDFVEVLAVEEQGFRLRLHFIPHSSKEARDIPPELAAGHLRVLDERERLVPTEVLSLEPPEETPAAVDVTFRLGEGVLEQLRYGPLTLALSGLPSVDPPFSRAGFHLRVERGTLPPPSPDMAAARPLLLPPGSYLARDFESFTRLLLDRMSQTVPDWQERHTADLGVTLVELLAHAGDLLSYYQDAVSAEAYLGTAQRRASLRRHARLLDYTVHEGCNARTWVHLTLATGVDTLELPAGTRFLPAGESPLLEPGQLLPPRPLVFESMAPARLHAAHNAFQIYTWGAGHGELAQGATSATLTGHFPRLSAGDVLLFEEEGVHPRRHAIRLSEAPVLEEDVLTQPPQPLTRVSWFPEDALPFPLAFGSTTGGQPLCQVLGNVVLADEGESFLAQVTVEAGVPVRLPLRGLSVGSAEPWEEAIGRTLPAAEALVQQPRRALPCVRVHELREDTSAPQGVRAIPWTVQEDLLSSGRFDRHCTAGIDDGAQSLELRFGDGWLGRRMRPGARLEITWRGGLGPAGNVAADTLQRLEHFRGGVLRVRNPLPASGGTAPEPAERVRRDAPRAFRTQERCVTEEDFSELAQRLPEVRQAVTRLAWNGSWHVARVHVLAAQGRLPSAALLARLQRYLSHHCLMGMEVEVQPPELVPLEISLRVGVRPGLVPLSVRRALEQELGSGVLPGGRTGFFHPSAFGLGQPVYLAPVVARAADVPGVAWVEPVRFQRWGKDAASALELGRIPLEPQELALVEGHPGRPDLGTVHLHLVSEGA